MSGALERLPAKLRKFAEARASGMTLAEAAVHAGSAATTARSAKEAGLRLERREEVRLAIAELQRRLLEPVEGDEDGLLAATARAIQEVLANKANPTARMKAAELVLKLSGKLRTQHAHLHAHLHAGGGDRPGEIIPPLAPDEERRLMRIALRGRRGSCPTCGASIAVLEALERAWGRAAGGLSPAPDPVTGPA